MPKKTQATDPDRHLSQRNGYFTYKRRVPSFIGKMDDRYPVIRIALHTNDLAEARIKRDAHEKADHDLWSAYTDGSDQTVAEARYKGAVTRAQTLGFTYRQVTSILLEESGVAILERLRAVLDKKPGSSDETAILGGLNRPSVSLQSAFRTYIDKIAAPALVAKSAEQRKLWVATRTRAINHFEAVCGPRNIGEITRDDAKKFYDAWLGRIAPNPELGIKPTHKAGTGNKELGILRVLFSEYFAYAGGDIGKNPFENLHFDEKFKDDRPPFPTEWIIARVLRVGALAGLNDEARCIVLVVIETGCRPSEVANLTSKNIRLDHPIPHIKVEPSLDPKDPREIKNASSIREIPLVGVALEAMKRFPDGFPRYRDKGNQLSAVLGKYFEENGLFPTDRHVIYSFRHSFEDRAKEAELDTELRMILMGHTVKRPKYGQGGSLAWKERGLAKMALPFDPAIV